MNNNVDPRVVATAWIKVLDVLDELSNDDRKAVIEPHSTNLLALDRIEQLVS